MSFQSKLPNTGTNIFSVMTSLAKKHNAINLAQGFPGFKSDEQLINLVSKYMSEGYNQYAPMGGVTPLLHTLSDKMFKLYGHRYDPNNEITITAGATQAIFTSITALVQKDDEVIVIEPAYDSYIPSITIAGGKPILFALNPNDYSIDWDQLEKLITAKTKVIIINSPHNPTGAVLKESDIVALERIVEKHGLLVISDEVYEHIVFDRKKHLSLASSEILRNHSLLCYSFGKVFHNTGWKTGYVVGPEWMIKEFRKIHQFEVFSCNTPMQFAFAEYLKDETKYLYLNDFFQRKRDLIYDELKESLFEISPCQGTYFQTMKYGNISNEPDMKFAERITKEHGVALIPVSAFYRDKTDHKIVRLCFAKTDEELLKACSILKAIT